MSRRSRKSAEAATIAFSTFSVAAILLACAAPSTSLGQTPQPVNVTDRLEVGQPERVEISTGRYKKVHRNRARQVVREEVYETYGTLFMGEYLIQVVRVVSVYPDGRPAEASVAHRRPLDGSDKIDLLRKSV